MWIFAFWPIQSFLFFLIAPTVGGFIGYNNASAHQEKEKYAAMRKGIGIGLLIDIPLLCLVLFFGSAI